MCDLWWTKWQWCRFLLDCLGFRLSLPFNQWYSSLFPIPSTFSSHPIVSQLSLRGISSLFWRCADRAWCFTSLFINQHPTHISSPTHFGVCSRRLQGVLDFFFCNTSKWTKHLLILNVNSVKYCVFFRISKCLWHFDMLKKTFRDSLKMVQTNAETRRS